MTNIDDPRAFAESVNVALGLSVFIDKWNDGIPGHSVINTFRDFEEAVAPSESLQVAYMNAVLEARRYGIVLKRELKRVLAPQIRGTADRAVQTAANAWARNVAASGAFAYGCTVDLHTKADWINWCLENVRCPMVVSPEGTRSMSYLKLRPKLRSALAIQFDRAVAAGWIGAYDRSGVISLMAAKEQRDGIYSIAEIRRIAMTPIMDILKPNRPK